MSTAALRLVLLLPGLAFIAVSFILPLLWLVSISFLQPGEPGHDDRYLRGRAA